MLLILILTFIQLAHAYFEQRLTRRAVEYSPSKSRVKLNSLTYEGCQPELMNLKHNATYVTQMCFTKDLFFNMELMIGNSTDVFEMSIDLTSPWTWVKSSSCKKCPKFDPSNFEDTKSCGKSSKGCSNDNFTQTFDSSHFQDSKKSASIFSHEFMVSGRFISDDIKFMTYNSSNNEKLVEYIKAKLDFNETLNEIIIKRLKFLNVQRLYGPENVLADGVIGLGFGYTETDEEEAQPDTDFVEILMKQESQLQLSRQQFAIYILETGPYFPHFVIQFGGYDVKYAHEHSNDVVWLDRVENSGYYWMVELESFFINYYQKIDETHIIHISKKKAIFTLSSQFIELPKEELALFIDKMNDINNDTDCHVIDDDVENFKISIINYQLLLVYCTNLSFPKHFIDLKLHFKFGTTQGLKEITLNSFLIFKNCNQHKDDVTHYDCLLNIRYSKSDFVILGEPFMKWHYVIFLNEPEQRQQIGILPAATNMYYKDHPKSIFESEGWSIAKIVLYIFLTSIVLICCIANFKRFAKDLIRSIRFRGQLPPGEEGKLRVRNYEENQNDFQEDFEMRRKQAEQEEMEKKEKQWKESNKQFNFQQKFESQLEDHSL